MSTSMLCRVCVSEQSELLNMLNLYYGSTPATTFIMDILQIKVDSEGSSALVMCSSCNTTLNNFYSFYNMVRDAQHKYNQIKVQDGMTREISFIDIKPHTSFIDCKTEYVDVKDEIVDEQDSNMECNNDCDENPINHIEIPIVPQKYPLLIAFVSPPTKVNQPPSLAMPPLQPISRPCLKRVIQPKIIDNSKSSTAPNIQTQLNKEKIISNTKSKGSVFIPRSQKATTTLFEKYKVEDIYSKRKWKISQKKKDEIFKLYIDMKCSACNTEFQTYNELDEHCITEHNTCATVTCDDSALPSYKHMERHILYRHILNVSVPRIKSRIPCEVCNKLVVKCYMRDHLSRHLPPEKREFQCNQCDAGFGLRGVLNAHIAAVHLSSEVTCDECGRVLKSKLNYELHKKNMHSSSSNKFLCPECGKEFKRFSDYNAHVKKHQGIENKVKCPICDVVLQKSSIAKHLEAHDPKNEKQCPHCPYKGIYIPRHIKRVHDKIKRYTCSLCPMTFFTGKAMEEHISARHTGIPGYSCEFCDKTFMNSGNLHKHRKRMHPEQWVAKKRKIAKKTDPDSTMPKRRKNRNIIVEGTEADVMGKETQS